MALGLGGAGLVVASLSMAPPAPPPAETVAPEPVVIPVPDAPVSAPAVVATPPQDVTDPQSEVSENVAAQADPPQVPALPLPDIALLPAPEAAAPEPPDVRITRPGLPEAAAPAEPAPDLPAPLIRYAADFDYAADLPLVALVLLDDPAVAEAPDLIAQLPFVPSVVLDAGSPEVTARMRAYRAAGIEVIVTATLPQGARPSDVEVTYQAAFDLVPEAIAVFTDGAGPADDAALADQVTGLIAESGRGHVTLPRGPEAITRPAEAAMLPVAHILRDVDGAGETRDVIERNLAQMSFRARQTGSAVVLARITPETLAAITRWANRSDPAQVALVPVSAVLLGQLPPP